VINAMILISLDVTKLEKGRFFHGKKGIYADLALIERPDDFGNDGFVVQSVTKEERDAGDRGPIVGKWRTVSKNHGKPVTPKQPQPQAEEDDIPF